MPRSGFTEYQQLRMLKRAFGSINYSEPTILYIGGSTTTVNVNGTGATEPTDSAYARVAVTNNTSNWGELSVGVGIKNLTPIEFPTASTVWGTITYAVIYDAPTGGNMLYYSELINPKTIGIDDVLKADPDGIQVRLNPTV